MQAIAGAKTDDPPMRAGLTQGFHRVVGVKKE
jgi:hypothetical protein